MSTDYLYTDGIKVFLNKETINSIEKNSSTVATMRGWGEVQLQTMVRSGPEGSINLIFNTWGGDISNQAIKKPESISV